MHSTISRISRAFRSFFPAAALGLAVMLGSGCGKEGGSNKSTSSNEGVAFVDLDRVSKALQWPEDMKTALEATQRDYKGQIELLQRQLATVLDEQKERTIRAAKLSDKQADDLRKIGDLSKVGLTDAQKTELINVAAKANSVLEQANNQANQMMQYRQQQIIAAYTESVKPSIRHVATANGYTAVTFPGGNWIWSDTSVDITDKVIDEVTKARPEHPLPEARKLQLPQNVTLEPVTQPTTLQSAGPVTPPPPSTMNPSTHPAK